MTFSLPLLFAVVVAKALYLPVSKTYWFAWFPWPEQGVYTIWYTSKLVLNRILKQARVSFEGSGKICRLVLTIRVL